MDSVDYETPNNLKFDESLISRVENLRSVLRGLKDDLKNERKSLHHEIEMTLLRKFEKLSVNYNRFTDHKRHNRCPGKHTRIPCSPLKLRQQSVDSTVVSWWLVSLRPACNPYRNVDQDASKATQLACLGSRIYQRAIDDLQDELNSFERRLSARAFGPHRRKIYDLEAICSADLNRVRSRFVKSLQAFQNTIHPIEELGPSRIKRPSCPCAANTRPDNHTNVLTLARPVLKNARLHRSAPTAKSLVINNDVRVTWWTSACLKRYSDSEMYTKIHRSTASKACSIEDQESKDKESVDSFKGNKSFTVLFPCAFKASRTLI